MVSKKYRTFLFIYSTDLNESIIKRQKVYLNDLDEFLIPITPKFIETTIEVNQKITETSDNLRKLLLTTTEGNFVFILPYSSNNSTALKQLIEEILADSRIICAEYQGENLAKNVRP